MSCKGISGCVSPVVKPQSFMSQQSDASIGGSENDESGPSKKMPVIASCPRHDPDFVAKRYFEVGHASSIVPVRSAAPPTAVRAAPGAVVS